MASFDCLSKEANLFGKFLLEASAGTGKTFAIEQIALRLLIEKKEHLLIDEILMVTFTRAAASDLKKRILTNIEKTIDFVRQPVSDSETLPEYLSHLLQEGKKEEILHSLQEALLFFDRAQIFTIHGFCSRMLQEFAFEAKESHAFSFHQSGEEEKLLRESLFDLLYYEDVQEKILPFQVAILLKKFQEPKRLLRYLQNSRTEESLSAKVLLQKVQEILESYPIQGKEIWDSFEKLFPHFKISSFKKNELATEVKLLSRLSEKKSATFADIEELLKTRCTLFSFLQPGNKKAKGPSFEELFSKESPLWVFEEKLYPLLKKALSSSPIASLLQNAVLEKMEKKLEKSDRFTFDWILKKMKKALDHREFVEGIRNKYRAVMIDEFQDTDPLQWEIFRRLFLEEGKTPSFFLVGDPKQSIYRFRKADLYTYFEAARFLGKEALFFLDTNYRASPALVEALNALFSFEISSSWLSLPELKKELPYHPVKAGLPREEEWSDGKKSLHFFIASPQEKTPLSAERLFFSYLSREIQHLHTNHRIAYQKMAILVKDRYQQERLKEHFLEKRIPISAKNQKSIVESDAAWAFREFFQALFFPQELSFLRRALTGPLMNWSFQELILDFEQGLPELLSKLGLLKDLLEKEGFSHFFRELLSSVWKEDGQSVLEKLVSRKDLSFYEDTLTLFDLLQHLEKERGCLPGAIVSFFEEMKVSVQETEKTESQEGVRIMTLHASKGLEFEIVFALGLASPSPFFEEEESGLEEDAEKMRQFYVALTRAKKRAYVPFIGGEERKIERGKVSSSDLFCAHVLKDRFGLKEISPSLFLQKMDRLKEAGHLSIEKIEESVPMDPIRIEEIELFPPPILTLPHPSLRSHSFSQLTQHEVEKKEGLFFDENYLFSPQMLPQGKEMGVWVHHIFEKVFSSARETPLETIIEEELFGTPFYQYGRKIKEMVQCALQTPLEIQGATFCLHKIDRKELFAEMEFLFTLAPSSDLMKGSIDLLFFHEGKYYFVDWKTNWLGDAADYYQRASLEKAMEEHRYFLQAAIYREAVERFVKKTKGFSSFGGAFYLFLRGLSHEKKKNQGVFAFFPEKLNQDSSLCIHPHLV